MNQESTLKQVIPQFSTLAGWLSEEEGEELFRLAAKVKIGCIVEVGSYRGRSTVALCAGSCSGFQVPVFAVEPHEMFISIAGVQFGPQDRAAFFETFLQTGLYPFVRLLNTSSAVVTAGWKTSVALLFIDGDHRYEGVRSDYELWRPHLAAHATVVFDDVGLKEGPGRLTSELVTNGDLVLLRTIGKMATFEFIGQAIKPARPA
jgi:predicted O-methyltransferase YrrM